MTVIRQRGVVYDTGRSLGSLSMNWRPDYTEPLMRRELDIIRTGLHANAVRLGGRDPRRLLAAADYAASIGLDVWLGDEQAQARLLIDQLKLLGQAGVDRAFVMSFSFPLAPYSQQEDGRDTRG
ncbi:MAG: hypothetical protein ABSB59_39030 [Streptosporangiaceae bacterium]|jgi:hypothetical protein